MDLQSLKVNDLKSECRARGLPISGTKNELVARLVQAMTTERQDDSVLDDDLLEDDSMLGSEDDLDTDVLDQAVGVGGMAMAPRVTSTSAVSSSSPTKTQQVGSSSVITSSVGSTSPTKKVLVTSNQNGEDEQKKKKLTINREPVEAAPSTTATTVTTEQKTAPSAKTSITAPGSVAADATDKSVHVLTAAERAQLRAQKFGGGAATAAAAGTAGSTPISPVADEKLKKRAEKFGATPDLASTPAKISLVTEDSIRLAKRKERFGVVETVTAPGSISSVTINKGKTGDAAVSAVATAVSKTVLDENKLKRAARFMLGATTAEVDEKKKARADRFK
jgi:hypothetical protein